MFAYIEFSLGQSGTGYYAITFVKMQISLQMWMSSLKEPENIQECKDMSLKLFLWCNLNHKIYFDMFSPNGREKMFHL